MSRAAPGGPPPFAARPIPEPRARPIAEFAADRDLAQDDPVRAGAGVLRGPVETVHARFGSGARGRLVRVTAMTPTEHGDGETSAAIGLAMALHRRGRRSVVCLRARGAAPEAPGSPGRVNAPRRELYQVPNGSVSELCRPEPPRAVRPQWRRRARPMGCSGSRAKPCA
jgi:hypothetical protein